MIQEKNTVWHRLFRSLYRLIYKIRTKHLYTDRMCEEVSNELNLGNTLIRFSVAYDTFEKHTFKIRDKLRKVQYRYITKEALEVNRDLDRALYNLEVSIKQLGIKLLSLYGDDYYSVIHNGNLEESGKRVLQYTGLKRDKSMINLVLKDIIQSCKYIETLTDEYISLILSPENETIATLRKSERNLSEAISKIIVEVNKEQDYIEQLKMGQA